MAFPVVASTSSPFGTGAVPPSISLPTGTAAGDLVMVAIAQNCAASGSPAITAPTGVTTLYNRTSGNTAVGLFWKIATATDITNGNLAFTFGGSSSNDSIVAGIARITGYDTATPIKASNDNLNTAGGITSATTSGISSTLQPLLLIFTTATKTTSGNFTLSNYAIATNNPTWTELASQVRNGNSGSNYSGVTIASAPATAAGATGTASATYSAAVAIADLFIVAIQPPHTVITPPFILSSTMNAPTFQNRIVVPAFLLASSLLAPVISAVGTAWRTTAKHVADWINEPKS